MALDADVLFEPLTERLVAPGFQLRDFTYGQSGLFSTAELSRDANARTRLVRDVVGGHPDTATLVTPPHFYVEDDHSFELNIALAEEALQTSKREIRPVLLVNRVYADKNAAGLANSYAMAGITRLELRLTPVGGDDESLCKIRSVFAICAAFTAAGIEVTLGASGNIGPAAVALGHAAHYSVGVGLLEQVDYKAAINRQSAAEACRGQEAEPGRDRRQLPARSHGRRRTSARRGFARQHRHPHQNRLPPRLLRDQHQGPRSEPARALPARPRP